MGLPCRTAAPDRTPLAPLRVYPGSPMAVPWAVLSILQVLALRGSELALAEVRREGTRRWTPPLGEVIRHTVVMLTHGPNPLPRSTKDGYDGSISSGIRPG